MTTHGLVATDIDSNTLRKLRATAREQVSRFTCKRLDVTRNFSFSDQYFDGVLCTGTLHLFKPKRLRHVVKETKRVLKPGGQLLFDFATNVRRQRNGETIEHKKGASQYRLTEAKKIWKKTLIGFESRISSHDVPLQKIGTGSRAYFFSSKYLLIHATKKTNENKSCLG